MQGNEEPLMGSKFAFQRRGDSGIEFSELLPNIGAQANDLCVVRSLFHEDPNHPGGTYMLCSCNRRPGRPSLGAWVVYGLGSESQTSPRSSAFAIRLCSIPAGRCRSRTLGFPACSAAASSHRGRTCAQLAVSRGFTTRISTEFAEPDRSAERSPSPRLPGRYRTRCANPKLRTRQPDASGGGRRPRPLQRIETCARLVWDQRTGDGLLRSQVSDGPAIGRARSAFRAGPGRPPITHGTTTAISEESAEPSRAGRICPATALIR